ncbi:MAG: NUDIX domain-containing protein [Acidimicrobiales bacterium]
MRKTVRELVANIEPLDSQEAEHRADVLAWIDSGVEIFRAVKPATPPKHLVSYCVLVDSNTERALLVDHRDAELWLPAGGHVEQNEHPAATARRETLEELQIAPNFLPEVGDVPLFVTVTETVGQSQRHTDVSLWFVFGGSEADTIVPDEREFAATGWWSFEDVKHGGGAQFDPHLPRFVDKLRQRLVSNEATLPTTTLGN